MAAHTVSFDTDAYLMESELESPAGEEDIHNSFSELIEEQHHILNNNAEDIEMYPLEPEDENPDEFSSFMATEANEDNVPTDPQTGEGWSTETLRILSSMPSRTIGRSRGAILSQYYNRTMQLCRRRHSMHPTIRSSSRSARPSICGYRVETDVAVSDREESKRERLVNNLQNLSISERVRMLKAIPLNLTEKSELRRLALNKTGHSSNLNELPCCIRFKNSIVIAFRHGWYSWLSFLSSLQLWQNPLKKVSGRFGTGVLSYFVFLRTLFFFNVFLFLVTGLFLVIPQSVRPPDLASQADKQVHYYGLEVLIGTGYFKESLLYYGYYSNSTFIQHNSYIGSHSLGSFSYNMPLAYFFTIGMAFFITCIILVYSMSKSFGQSFRINRSKGLLAVKVFCSWDFKVSKKSSVKVQSENICTQLRELVADVNQEKVKSTCWQCMSTATIQVLAWTICIGSTVVCSLAVYYFSEYMNRHREKGTTVNNPMLKEASLLALPVVVSSINLLLPGFFNGVAWMEEYDSPWKRNYVAIFRNLMLKVSLLVVLCYHWLVRVASNEGGLKCWESFVGQEVYRFLLMDFVFTMLDTFFGEFLWRVFTQKVLKKDRKPVFDIARNVLELIYGQTLAWLGVLFTPLLPAVQVIKLFMLFYMKKTSLMMNCQAPRKPWRASQMTTFFITLLCFPSFLGAAVCVTYTMWTIKPSADCGPFQGLNSMFQAGKKWVEDLAQTHPHLSWMVFVHTYLVENPVFLFVAAGIFLIVIYFHSQVVDGQRKIIELLQEQIENEGDDKKFLITRLQNIHEQKRPSSRRQSRRNVEGSSVS